MGLDGEVDIIRGKVQLGGGVALAQLVQCLDGRPHRKGSVPVTSALVVAVVQGTVARSRVMSAPVPPVSAAPARPAYAS